jgi:hypothetical protein
MEWIMKRLLWLAALAAATTSSAIACSPPAAPGAIPDGKSAAMEKMMAVKKEVDQYKKDVEAYLSCEKNTGKADSVQADLEKIANKFNAEVRAFKAANADK